MHVIRACIACNFGLWELEQGSSSRLTTDKGGGGEKKVKNEICAGLRRPDLAETRDHLD